jgi:hypothetical protein
MLSRSIAMSRALPSQSLACIYCPNTVPPRDPKGKGRTWSNTEPSYAQILRPTLDQHNAHREANSLVHSQSCVLHAIPS